MYFYLLFTIALQISHKHRGLLSIIFISLIFVLAQTSNSFMALVYGDLIVLEFALGIIMYMIMMSNNHRQIYCVIFPVLIFSMLVFVYYMRIDHRFFKYGIPAFLIIFLALKLLKDIKIHPIFSTLGGASYALYLTHPYTIKLFTILTDWFSGTNFQKIIAIILSIIFVNIIAVLFYKYIEKPTQISIKRALLK